MAAPKVTHVSIRMPGGYNLVPFSEFVAKPLNERISMLVDGRVQFLDETGATVPIREAMAQVSAAARAPKA